MKNSEWVLLMLSWAQLFHVAKKALAWPPLLWALPAANWENFLLFITIPLISASVDGWSLRHSAFLHSPWRKGTPNKQIRIDRNWSEKLTFQRWTEEFTAVGLKLPNSPLLLYHKPHFPKSATENFECLSTVSEMSLSSLAWHQSLYKMAPTSLPV